jgi:hypothetical protein
METTEKIVESYCRYVKGWFTISNIKCSGQYEIDLIAIEAPSEKAIKRYHIESGVSISGGFSKLTAKPFSQEELKKRTKQAGQRRTLGYFRERKFNSPDIISELKKFGFNGNNYSKIIVTWGWEEEAKRQADYAGIILWDFRDMIKEIAETLHKKKTYFTDDTLRTIQLFVKAED